MKEVAKNVALMTRMKSAWQAKTKFMLCSALLFGGAFMVSSNENAQAATATNNFTVTATVVSACNVSSSTMNFGAALDPLIVTGAVDTTSTITVNCSNTTGYSLAINAGTNAGSATNFAGRVLKNGNQNLPYQLYTDNGRSNVWGDGTSSSTTYSGTGTGSTQTVSVYGRIPSIANIPPGTYTDSVTVTITY